MKVEFLKSFEKDLLKILDAKMSERIQEVIEQVEEAENVSAVSNLKKLKGEADYYRIRVGDYRIGIKVKEYLVSFVRILHRKDIYRYFP